MTDNPFEIPQHMRDLAEQNMKRAHAAYAQLMDFVTKTMNAWMAAMPANPMTAGLKDVQGRAMEFAKENAEATFTLSSKIGSTQNLQEILRLQMQFAEDRMQAFATQTQQLFTLIEKAIQKSESGATAAGMGATPSSPIVTGIEDVEDRAVAMAKTHAESAFAPVEKVAEVQNFQAPSDNEKPPRRKPAKSKTATSGTSNTPLPPTPTPVPPRSRNPRSKSKSAKKEAAARGAALHKDE